MGAKGSGRRFQDDNTLKGRRFGHLVTLEVVRTIGVKAVRWKCKCDCGNIVSPLQYRLLHGETKSCGCTRQCLNQGAAHNSFRGYGELGSQYVTILKNGAKRRKHEFLIDVKYMWELFVKQNRRCALTNLPIVLSSQQNRRRGIPQTASLDRIDSSKGYIEGNVQWVHKDVNRMKQHFSEQRFVEVCTLVMEHQLRLQNARLTSTTSSQTLLAA